MADNHDYIALDWVRGEINQTLAQAETALEAYGEARNDSTQLTFCLNYIHQVHGTLQMVEFYGAALLAEEMEALCQALLAQNLANPDEALDVLMGALIQLQNYLEHIQSGQKDLPLALLPALNDLRAAQGRALLSESSLFMPDLQAAQVAINPAHSKRMQDPQVIVNLRKLRQMFQVSLAGLIRNQDTDKNLDYLRKVLTRLEKFSKDTPIGKVWWVAMGFIDSLEHDSMGSATKQLLRDLDAMIKDMIEQPNDILVRALPQELLKNLLYYIAQTGAQTERVKALKAAFKLDELSVSASEVDAQRQQLQGPDQATLDSVVSALSEELAQVKEQFEVFVRSREQDAAVLEQQVPALQNIANTLAVMGFGTARTLLLRQIVRIQTLVDQGQGYDEQALMQIAADLIQIELALANHADTPDLEATPTGSVVPSEQFLQAHDALISEAKADLDAAKNHIVEFIASQWDHSHIRLVPELLERIRGGLQIIPLPRAAELLACAIGYIETHILAQNTVPEWEQLDRLADALSSIEYYMDRLSAGASDNERILDMAQTSLRQLGALESESGADESRDTPESQHQSEVAAESPEASVKATDEDLIDIEILEIFVEEVDDVLDLIDDSASHMAKALEDQARYQMHLKELRRAYHTLKGSGRLVGASDIGELAWSIESLLNKCLEQADLLRPDEQDLLAEARQLIPVLLNVFSQQAKPTDEQVSEQQQDVLGAIAFKAEMCLQARSDSKVRTPTLQTSQQDHSIQDQPETQLESSSSEASQLSSTEPQAQLASEASDSDDEQDDELIEDEILEIFIEEADDVYQEIEQQLPALLADFGNSEALSELRRAYHTLKGSGRMVSAGDIGETAWSVENLLNRVMDGSVGMSPEVAELLSFVSEQIPALVTHFKHGTHTNLPLEALQAHAEALANGESTPALSTVLSTSSEVVPSPEQADSPAGENSPEQELDDEQDNSAESEDAAEETLLDIFEAEANGHLATVEEFIARAHASPQPLAIDDGLSRAWHTLKGSANTAGIGTIAALATPTEKLVKELRAHSVGIDQRSAELLQQVVRLIQQKMSDLQASEVPESAVLVEQVDPDTQAYLEALKDHYDGILGAINTPSEADSSDLQYSDSNDAQGREGSERSEPTLLAEFLSSPLDILLDADIALDAWTEQGVSPAQFKALCADVSGLHQAAQAAGLAEVETLCAHLQAVYPAFEANTQPPTPEVLNAVKQGHETLLNNMDQLAAGLSVEVNEALLEHLNSLADGLATDAESDSEPEFEVGTSTESERDIELEVHVEPEVLVELEPDLSRSLAQLENQLEQALPAYQGAGAEPDEATSGPAPELETGQSIAELDPELVEIFLEEAQDIIDNSAELLGQWEQAPDNTDLVAVLQRELHTLKGGARMAEISQIGDIAHELESLFERIVEKGAAVKPSWIPLCLRSHDTLASMVDALAAGEALPDSRALLASLHAIDDADDKPNQQADSSEFESSLELENSPELDESPEQAEQNLEPSSASAAPDSARFEFSGDDSKADIVDADDEELSLIPMFLEESRDILGSSFELLEQWRDDPANHAPLELEREMHTLKGGARLADIDAIADIAEAAEQSLASYVKNGTNNADNNADTLINSINQACLGMQQMLDALNQDEQLSPAPELINALVELRAAQASQQQDQHATQADSAAKNAEREALAIDDDLLAIFLEEAQELSETLEQQLAEWSEQPTESRYNQDIQRTLHTLKGGARLANIKTLAEQSHALETELVSALAHAQAFEGDFKQQVLASQDAISQLIEQLQNGQLDVAFASPAPATPSTTPPTSASAPSGTESAGTPVSAKVEPLEEMIAEAITPSKNVAVEPKAPSANSTKSASSIKPANRKPAAKESQKAAPQETIRVSSGLLEDLVNLAGETSISRGRLETQISDFGFTLDEMSSTIERLREQLRRLEIETEAQVLFRAEREGLTRQGYEDFDPLEMDRYSSIQHLSRSLTESSADLQALRDTLADKARGAETLLLQQSRINSELQEGLMKTRMIPFSSMVPRLRRITRQISGELGKQVELVVSNAEGEMDRSVLERMIAPLEHMLRNALDHGIESADERMRAGKPEAGTIRLSLMREGGDVVLRMRDDGAGIDDQKILDKALSKGLVSANKALSRHEILQFIMLPGFSTAEQVTQISGRGVGMDVVLSEIKQMGGSIEIESELGHGTQFSVRLPFTVSVNRALMVNTGDDFYAIPLNTIEGIVRVSSFELEEYYQPNAPKYEYAGQSYELQYLGKLLHSQHQPKLQGQPLPLPVILVRGSDKPMALQVDSVMGSREIVVKSMGTQFAGVQAVSGATILGDGSVVVILDLPALIRDENAGLMDSLDHPEVLNDDRSDSTLVMVVDDSVTVRKVTSRLLERHGMEVLTANDGVDAIAKLQEHKPDVILLDIEMPRMDGFEVATLVRHDERLKSIPIIMITSRTGQKHRDRAFSIGVREYLGKPFQEQTLLETIDKLVQGD